MSWAVLSSWKLQISVNVIYQNISWNLLPLLVHSVSFGKCHSIVVLLLKASWFTHSPGVIASGDQSSVSGNKCIPSLEREVSWALLSTGIIFVYRISTINLLLSGIPTPSATNLFIIWLICVKMRVYTVTQFPRTPFTFSGGKTTRNTSHSSAVFPCITTARNRWHLLIENRWSCLYAAGSAPPLARLLFVCCVCRHTCYWKSVGAWHEGQINQAHFIWEALMPLVKDGMLNHPSAQLLICH